MGEWVEDLLEVAHQAVDVHQPEALEVAVDAPQLVVQAQAQEVDSHQLEALEVDRQVEVGLEMVLEVQEVAQELVGIHTSTHPLMLTTKPW